MLPDVYMPCTDSCKIEQSSCVWSNINKETRLHQSLQGLTALLCSTNAFWSSKAISETSTQVLLKKLLITWNTGGKKWLTVLIQTYSILRLHKSNQNFRYSALSGYVKQSLGIKAKVSTWKIAIITQNLKLNKIQIGFPQKKSCVEKKYKSYFFLIWDDSRPEDLAIFSVDQESKSEVK